jgi:hypothetical protein
MVRKAYKPEQIINKLREAEVLLSQGVVNQRKWDTSEPNTFLWLGGAK